MKTKLLIFLALTFAIFINHSMADKLPAAVIQQK